MDSRLADLESIASSQISIASTDKENTSPIFSSPQKSESTYTQRQKRPPTITPKRFSRFFTPRTSSRQTSRSGRFEKRLRDVTYNAANSASSLLSQDFSSSERPLKRRKRTVEPTSTPQSSPLKRCVVSPRSSPTSEQHGVESECSSEEDTDVFMPRQALPTRIRRLGHQNEVDRVLLRSFGDLECTLRGQRSRASKNRHKHSTRDYVTLPDDTHSFRGTTRSLPFCTTACNTNSLVCVGDEQGAAHFIDTASGTSFSKAHVTIRAHNNAIMDMSFSSCDYLLATTSGDQTVRIIDVQTQKTQLVLAGHRSSIKQVHFQPDNDNMVTTSARDGIVNIWDLRCSAKKVQAIRVGLDIVKSNTIYPYRRMLAGPSHRMNNAKHQIARWLTDGAEVPAGVSITAIQHLPGSRSHLLLSASEVNSSLKLFDLRVAGRSTKNEKHGYEVPVSCTPTLPSHRRNFGISALALSTDGGRAYSICKDSTVWVYSTQHLTLGCAPEMINKEKRTRLAAPDATKEGLGPIYGFRHPKMDISSFYVKTGVRKLGPDQEEMLAVGSRDACAVLFPTEEKLFRERQCRENADQISRQLFQDAVDLPPIYNVGTALVQGHRREVTSLTFAHGGELVTLSDDYTARCWRQEAGIARGLRQSTGDKWRYGWADTDPKDDKLD